MNPRAQTYHVKRKEITAKRNRNLQQQYTTHQQLSLPSLQTLSLLCLSVVNTMGGGRVIEIKSKADWDNAMTQNAGKAVS